MQEKYSLDELKDIVKEFCSQRDWDQFHNPKDLAIGITTEASELLEIFRFKTPEQIEKILSSKSQEIEDELADILFMIVRFSQKYNFDLSKAFSNKIEKNNQKYPVETSKGSNKKYNE